ncbi:MAG: Spy/CpxP family protein refolding chaperone [Brachymonas sp.]
MFSTSSFSQHGKRRFVHALAGLVAVSAIGQAAAQSPAGPQRGGHDMGQMAERRIDHMIKEIDGTPEQKAKLTALAQAAQKDMAPLREQLQAARQKGMALLSAPTIDRAALERLHSEQTQLMDNLSRRMLTHMADAAEVLTPAQRAKLAEKMKSRSEGGRGRHGGHGGMGGGWFR